MLKIMASVLCFGGAGFAPMTVVKKLPDEVPKGFLWVSVGGRIELRCGACSPFVARQRGEHSAGFVCSVALRSEPATSAQALQHSTTRFYRIILAHCRQLTVGSHFLYVLPTTSYENASATCTMEQLTPLFSLRFLCIETQPKTTIQFSRTMTNASKCDDHRDSGRQSDSRSEFVHFVAL